MMMNTVLSKRQSDVTSFIVTFLITDESIIYGEVKHGEISENVSAFMVLTHSSGYHIHFSPLSS